MALPRYKKCCLCFDARTGALVLGLLGLFGAGFSLVSDSVGLGVYVPRIQTILDEYKEGSMKEFEEKGAPEEEREAYAQLWEKMDLIKGIIPWAFVIQLVTSIFNILLNGCLIYGISSNKPRFMLPWLIVGMAGIVTFSAMLAMAFVVMSIASPGGILSGIIVLALLSPFLAIGWYFWLVVRSVYLDLLEKVGGSRESQNEKASMKYVQMMSSTTEKQ